MLDRMVAGTVPAKPHTALRDAAGRLLYEECLTRDGFDGPFTIMYHVDRPHTAAVAPAAHGWAVPAPARAGDLADGDHRPLARRHYRSQALPSGGGAPIDARVPLLYNEDVVISALAPDRPDPVYFANGDGDDVTFVREGGGVVRSALGDVVFAAGDYVFVPRGLPHRYVPDDTPQAWLSIECAAGFGVPRQFRNDVGQLRMDAPYTHRDFRRPVFAGPRDEGVRDVVVKREGAFHGFRYPHAPLDVVGWDGAVYPWAFPISRFSPRVGQVHLPPTVHGTFAARGALICSFVPRPLDFHPDAVPCPYPHSSVACDEVILYCAGSFTSRQAGNPARVPGPSRDGLGSASRASSTNQDGNPARVPGPSRDGFGSASRASSTRNGIGPGSLSHHPAGVVHGPHPGAYEASAGARATDELAVMLDTFRPLRATAACRGVEDPDYHASFA